MACAVRYLNSAGIHHREVKGVEALAAAFPDDWLMFASLTAFDLTPSVPPAWIRAGRLFCA